jgi:hypothetical protein
VEHPGGVVVEVADAIERATELAGVFELDAEQRLVGGGAPFCRACRLRTEHGRRKPLRVVPWNGGLPLRHHCLDCRRKGRRHELLIRRRLSGGLDLVEALVGGGGGQGRLPV